METRDSYILVLELCEIDLEQYLKKSLKKEILSFKLLV